MVAPKSASGPPKPQRNPVPIKRFLPAAHPMFSECGGGRSVNFPTAPAAVFYTDAEVKSEASVCVIGDTVATKLFPYINPVGKSLRTREGNQFRVIGVLDPKGTSFTGGDQDDCIMIPVTTLMKRVSGKDHAMLLIAEARSSDLTNLVKQRMTEIIRRQHHIRPGQDDDFYVNTLREYASMAELFTKTLSGLIFAIASISLIVGGIGVMNIMLVSVTGELERSAFVWLSEPERRMSWDNSWQRP